MRLKMIRIVFLSFALLLPVTLQARLGESGEELAKRFGEETRPFGYDNASVGKDKITGAIVRTLQVAGGVGAEEASEHMKSVEFGLDKWDWDRVNFRGYQFGEFKVLIILLDDKSVYESYTPKGEISAQEVDALLQANSDGGKWRNIGPPPSDSLRVIDLAKKRWKIVDPATKKVSRIAVWDEQELTLFDLDIVRYCLDGSQAAAQSFFEKQEKEKVNNIKGF